MMRVYATAFAVLVACGPPHDDVASDGGTISSHVADATTVDAAAPADAFAPIKPLQWTVELAGANLTGVWSNNPKDVYVIGDDGSIEHSDNDGGSWTVQQSHVAHLSAIWGCSSDVYAVGGGAILHTSDRGQTWIAQPSPSAGPFYDVWGSAAGDVYVVGAGGTILHSADRGATWTAEPTTTTEDLRGVWGSGANDVYAVGGHSTMLHNPDAGHTWTSQLPTATWDFSSVWGAGANDVYAVGWDSGNSSSYVLESVDHGATWTPLGVGGPADTSPLHAVWASGPGDVYMVLSDILHSVAKPPGWITEIGGLDSPTAVRGSSPIDVWVSAFGGLMHGQP
jgi:photosystem II stability/assembly factor-like uncharacterized protein